MNSFAQAFSTAGLAPKKAQTPVVIEGQPEATYKNIFGGPGAGPLIEISLPVPSPTDWPCHTKTQFDTVNGCAFFGKNFSHVEGGVWVNFFVYGNAEFLKKNAGKKVAGRLELEEKTIPACEDFPERQFVLVNIYLSAGKAAPTHKIYVGDKIADKCEWLKFTTLDMKGICVAVKTV